MMPSFLSGNDGTLAAVGILVVAVALKYAFTDVRDNMYFSSIRVPDHMVGEAIEVDVVRSLKGTWHGAYQVDVHRSGINEPYCTTGPIYREYSQFEPDGTERTLPDPTTLEWWAYGGECTEILKGGALPAGQYSVSTCHAKRVLPFLYRWHCWGNDPVFRVKEIT